MDRSPRRPVRPIRSRIDGFEGKDEGMRKAILVAACGLAWLAASAQDAPPAGDESREGELLSRVRQLTFEGRRAGEGYFSPDGTRMVFQSEREPGNPFFQIYELDLTSGETRRVSTGTGKTTCAYYRPGSGAILFASTHHDPRSAELQRAELELRASGQERRYDWDFDPEMDLYLAEGDGGLRRLTDAPGYDAEGSFSPDGRHIVFTSTRQAYESALSEPDRGLLATDPSHFAEIYVAGADGSGPRRLTSAAGYDGGPFYMPGGGRIVWRRFEPGGAVADVWTMKPDGTDPRRITGFGSMSWAPYPHPSGEYLFFTSNKLGFANFEIFIVDAEGLKEPVRVTYTNGFDGLPVPTPDGAALSWTSNRRGGGAQILLGQWNHERARQLLERAPARSTKETDP
jgi:Tol biopolymer transport system component